jgi:hypothetical protein
MSAVETVKNKNLKKHINRDLWEELRMLVDDKPPVASAPRSMVLDHKAIADHKRKLAAEEVRSIHEKFGWL